MDATAPAVVAAVPALNTDQTAGWFTNPGDTRQDPAFRAVADDTLPR
jgi:hypothetical protein